MSWDAMQAMLDHSRAEGLARTVGLVIALRAEPDTNLAWPSNEDLMRWGFSERTIQNALRKLEQLGELVRRTELQSVQRRRVYLVRPPAQMSLLDSATVPRAPVVQVAPGAVQLAPTRARGRNDRKERNDNTPPTPPRGGLLEELHPSLEGSPRVTPGSERAAARRRRRRRERAHLAVLASGDCPLNRLAASAATDLELLTAGWQQVASQFREQFQTVERADAWLAGAHPHQIGHVLELGVSPDTIAWLRDRYGRALQQAARMPVRLVACMGALPEEPGS